MALKNRIVAFVAGALLGPAMVWAGLETGTYISDLVATNPLSSDLASTGDDHIRLLKSTIKATLPNLNGVVTATDEELSLLAGKTGTVWTSANDGSASGLDADTVDGAAPVTVANPSVTIGLTAVNGSSATAMRSDGAPELSQAIVPTWTGQHNFTKNRTAVNEYAWLVSSANPFVSWRETDASANNGRWILGAGTERYQLISVSDDEATQNTVFSVDRTGATVDNVSFPTDVAAGNFEVGPATGATVNNARMRVRTASSGVSAAQFTNGGGSGVVVAIHNQDTTVDAGFIGFVTDAASVRGTIDYNRAAAQVRYNVTSDERIKKNIQKAPSARNLIDCVAVLQYDIRETGYHVDYGFTAQSLHRCAPFAVNKPQKPHELWQVDYSKMVPAMVKYMQEQDDRIGKLEAQLKRMN